MPETTAIKDDPVTAPRPRPGILEIAPYVGGESAVPGRDRVIKLASNESALGPSPAAVAAMAAAAGTMHRYPDGHCTDLRRALADRHGLDPDRIVCGAGSDELISLLCRAYAGPGDQVLYSRHGFLMYPISARTVGAEPVAAPERDLIADVDALLARVTKHTRLLFLANPNNPTGTYLTSDALERLRAGLPERVVLVLDAAYDEYVDRPDYQAGERLVETCPNVVVTRTFSKIYGLGGVRLGWAYAPAAVADVLNRIRNPFNVSSPAQQAGIAALSDQAFVDRARHHNVTWRAWTTDALRGLGLQVGDSVCNFVLVRFPAADGRDAAAADAFLKDRGIIVRRMDAYGLPDALRISIGLAEEMQACVAALTEFVG
ncbi:MAG: histidinol-phosphate transaminase [Rhodospirillales bacterium]|nr:MAG: histidinol-phosphate transaminase [Rhodospirillales bacterium]